MTKASLFHRPACAAAAFLFGAMMAASGSAAPLFFDDFESGLGQWAPVGNGQVVADPLNASNNVLSFSATTTGGDIFTSAPINLVTGQQYEVSFDFYGEKGADSGSGGYAGLSQGTPGNHDWYAGTDPTNYITVSNPVILDDAATGWVRYTYLFTAPIALGSGAPTLAIRLMFEDFAFSGSTAGNAYFDNVAVSAVPLPAALPLLGGALGLLASLGVRRRRGAPA